MKWAKVIIASTLVNGAPGSFGGDSPASEPGALLAVVQPLHTSAVFRFDYFRSSKTRDDETNYAGATAQLKVLPELSRQLEAKAEVRFVSPSAGKDGKARVRVLEGYLTAHFSSADLRLGRQIVAWGRADGINPTDNLTPRDYVVLLPFEDDQRFGTTAGRLDVFITPEKTLTVFATPYFEPHKVPLSTSESAVVQELPSRTFSNTEFGVRLNRAGEGIDWSLSYFHGFNLLPSIRLGEAGNSSSLKARYDRVRVFGADFARNFGRFGFRGEFAYVDTQDRAGSDARMLNPSLFFVVGVDRTFFANLNLNVQYFRRQVRRFHSVDRVPDDLVRHFSRESALLTGQRDRTSEGVSFRIGNKWLHDTLEAEIFGIINVTTRDSFARPQVSYALTDRWKATLGYDWFSGDGDTQFGSQEVNRGAFFETRFSF